MASHQLHPWDRAGARFVRSSHEAEGSTALLADQSSEQRPQPDQHAPPLRRAQAGREGEELRGLTDITACDRFLLRNVCGSFTSYAPVCVAHQWVGHPDGCEHAAETQICDGRVRQLIAANRALMLQRRGFTVFTEGE